MSFYALLLANWDWLGLASVPGAPFGRGGAAAAAQALWHWSLIARAFARGLLDQTANMGAHPLELGIDGAALRA